MNKIKIEVPEGIRFLSGWEDFRLSNFPGKCIINKQIPGCGFTEYCIRSNENIILCSPRKLLLENKFNQHKDEVYLVRNEMDKDPDSDKDISKPIKDFSRLPTSMISEDTSKEKDNSSIYQRISSELYGFVTHCREFGIPIKILVTYDSYRIVQQILMNLDIFDQFYTVIDEFQSILHDSRFKSDTELGFINYLRRSHSALFVSATPMMDEYLDMLSDFRDLPYFELDWYTQDSSRAIKPSLKVLTMKSVGTKAEEIITKYLNGDFDRVVVMKDGVLTEVISDEAVFYVNSVNHIISIIKKMGLTPDQVNILCSNTEDNEKKIRKRLGKKFVIGSVPLKGVKPKMFTFCTRTTYLGADFYSYCAQSYIFSDSNVDCLAVDIEEDLPQILGRQRLFENPWKNSATFYYRYTADYKKMTQEDFQKIIDDKKDTTNNLLVAYNDSSSNSVRYSLANTYRKNAKSYSYKDDYVAVNKVINDTTGDVILKPVVNELVLVNEIRAFRIQQVDYADRFTVFTTIHNKMTKDDIVNREALEFLEEYNSLTEARKKMILLCESSIDGRLSKDSVQIVLAQIPDSDYIKGYYQSLGPERLKNLGYKRNNIERELGVVMFSPELLIQEIYSEFKEGERYTLFNLKIKLSNIYSFINYSSTPKANDIEKYFETKEYSTYEKKPDGGRRKIRGYELVKSREHELREELKFAE